jgi:hypothetical protein
MLSGKEKLLVAKDAGCVAGVERYQITFVKRKN